MFDPAARYEVIPRHVNLKDFVDYREEFVVRPPYQRKSVWTRKKKQALLDSLFRRYYVPRIVVREVRLGTNRTVKEIIDGQQRIVTAQAFLDGDLRLPASLEDLDPELPGKRYGELPVEIRRFVGKELVYDADIVKGIDDPHDPEHQKIAAEIFWRLQQGETLTYMEVAHARLSSLPRNFIVKYADDVGFDYEAYQSIDENPHKRPFFSVIDRKNDRMQHLALLARLLIVEDSDGAADLSDQKVMQFIEAGQSRDGIGNMSYEESPLARTTLANMKAMYEVFKDDVMARGGVAIKELRVEYFILSIYLLLRHIRKHYVFGPEQYPTFRDFVLAFHTRWKARREDDNDMLVFSDHRQQTASDIEVRQRILRQMFFEHMENEGIEILARDSTRAFSEAERIRIYRRHDGLCQECVAGGRSREEAFVPWREYEADHVVPHSRGGLTDVDNAQLLCRAHNRAKGARTPAHTEG